MLIANKGRKMCAKQDKASKANVNPRETSKLNCTKPENIEAHNACTANRPEHYATQPNRLNERSEQITHKEVKKP